MKEVRVNDKITAKTVRVIGPSGEQLGIFSKELALKKAQEYNLDLVEVASQADPPVCKIIDFSKFKYEQEKRERELKKRQRQAQLKEIRISPRIGPHDYEIKLEHIKEFLKNGHKVKVSMQFVGKEITHKEIGNRIIERLINDISGIGKIDKEPHMLGRSLVVLFSPK